MLQKIKKNLNRYQYCFNKYETIKLGAILFIIILVFGLSLSSQSLFAAWVTPFNTPPISSMAAPINTSTTTPQEKIGDLIISGNFYVSTTTGETPTLYVASTTGRVGIGTGTPESALNIYHVNSGPVISLEGEDFNYRGLKITDVNNTEKWFFGASGTDFVLRRDQLENNLVINGAGNIGLGANPSAVSKLLVLGDIDVVSGVLKINNATTTPNPWLNNGSDLYYEGGISIGTSTISTSSLLVAALPNSSALQIMSNSVNDTFNIVNSAGESVFEITAAGVLASGTIPIARVSNLPILVEYDPQMGKYLKAPYLGSYNGYGVKWGVASTTQSQSLYNMVMSNDSSYDNPRTGIGMWPVANIELSVSGNILAIGDVYSRGTTWGMVAPVQYPEPNYKAIAYGNNIYAAVGAGGLYTSPDGIRWTLINSTYSGNSIVYGNDMFVAVGDRDYNGIVLTSPDGVVWSRQDYSSGPFDRYWRSVTYCANKFVAVANSGDDSRVMYSGDGVNWNITTPPLEIAWATGTPIEKDWRAVTCGKDSDGTTDLMVAVAYNNWSGNPTSNPTIPITSAMTSYDGISWATSSPGLDYWTSVTYGNGKFVAVNYASPTRVVTSVDGLSWSPSISFSGWHGASIVYAKSKFVTVGSDSVSYSATGTVWTNALGSPGPGVAVVYGDKFVAINPLNGPAVSSDGITWTKQTSNLYDIRESVAFGDNTFVVVHSIESMSKYGRVMISTDGGDNWAAKLSSDELKGWRSIAFGNGKFVAVAGFGSDDKKAMYSTDGGNIWTATASGIGSSTDIWQSVANGAGDTFVAVTQGKAACSTDYGQNWNTYGINSNYWQSVAYGSGKFVAVSNNGNNNRVITSSDCVNWSTQTSAANNSWTSVTFGAGKFVAVSRDGDNRVMYSSDGVSWNSANNPPKLSWNSVTYGDGVFVAVDADTAATTSNRRVMTSVDGINWTLKISNTDAWQSVAYGNFGGVHTFVAAGLRVDSDNIKSSNLMLSTNKGEDNSWSLRVSAPDSRWRSVAYGNGLFVSVSGVGEKRILTSQTGRSWDVRKSPVDRNWSSVTYGNGLFVAVSATSSVGGGVITSSDGYNWVYNNTAVPYKNWTAVTYGADKFVAMANDGSGTDKAMYSYDGKTWISGVTPANANTWKSLTYGNNKFVAVADSGAGDQRIMTSDDGINWAQQVTTVPSAATDYRFSSITYGNGFFVAVSSNLSITMTSKDGINWTVLGTGSSLNMKSVAYGSGLFVAVAGSGNRMLISVDGLTWISRGSANYYSLTSVAYGNGAFVAVSDNGAPTRVIYSNNPELSITPTNNIYQGGMNVFGYLGLGTSDPENNLHVYQSTGVNAEIDIQSIAGANKHWAIYNNRASNDLLFWNNTPTGEKNILTLQDEGNVGIGNASPTTKLSLRDNVSGPIVSLMGLDVNYRGLKITDIDNLEKWFVGTDNANSFIISQNGGASALLVSNATGNIGIGVSNPAQKLEVGGNLKAGQVHASNYCAADGTGCLRTQLVCESRNAADAGGNREEKLACNPGYYLTGGGCDWELSGAVSENVASYPIQAENSWYCSGSGSGALLQIYVRCCK